MNLSLKTYLQRLSIRLCIAALGVVMSGYLPLHAQPVLNARNMALGGGGTAYLSGIEANFINPANLAIYDRKGTIHFNVGSPALFFEPILSADGLNGQYRQFAEIFAPLNPLEQQITTEQRTRILENNYSNNDLTSEHLARADFLWGGIQWKNNEQTYSLSLRTRMGSRTNVGRGWYSFEQIEDGDNSFRDFTLIKQLQVLHEVSLGYAQELQFINGLIPRINKLYLGIAPKLVIGGAYQNAIYDGRYIDHEDQPITNYTQELYYYSAGDFSKMTSRYLSGQNVPESINQGLGSKFNTTPTGYGAGIDLGLTYVLPLGSDVSLLDKDPERRPVGKTLRISLSITDIGIMYYSESPLHVQRARNVTQIDQQAPAETKFVGAAGQFINYFDRASDIPNPFLNATSTNTGNFSTLLPTTLNAGVVLDVNRAKLVGDLTIGLRNTAMTNTKLTARFGVETRPLPYLPVRFGTSLAADKPIGLTAGTGIETRHWDLTVGARILLKSNTLATGVTGGAVSALQFHF